MLFFPTVFGNNREKNNFPVKRRYQSIETHIDIIRTKHKRAVQKNIKFSIVTEVKRCSDEMETLSHKLRNHPNKTLMMTNVCTKVFVN